MLDDNENIEGSIDVRGLEFHQAAVEQLLIYLTSLPYLSSLDDFPKDSIKIMQAWIELPDNEKHSGLDDVIEQYRLALKSVIMKDPDLLFSVVNLGHSELLIDMIDSGADLEVTDHPEWRTPLMNAIKENQPEMVRILLENGANTESQNIHGDTALIIAVKQNDPVMVQLLLDYDANTQATDYNGKTAFDIANELGPNELVKMLEEAAASILEPQQAPASSSSAQTKFENAAKQIADLVIYLSNERGLYTDEKEWPKESMDVLLAWNKLPSTERNSDSDKKANEALVTISHVLATQHTRDGIGNALTIASGRGYTEAVKTLLDQGANIESTDDDEFTPLVAAAYDQKLETLLLLLNNDAAVHRRKESALFFAIDKGNIEIIKALLAQGANVNAVDRFNEPAFILLLSEKSKHPVALKTEIAKLLIQQPGFDFEATNSSGETALAYLISGGYTEGVDLFLKKNPNIDINQLEVFEEPALTFAARSGHTDIVDLLLKRGAEVDRVIGNDNTPLMEAVRFNQIEVVKKLLANGANVNHRNDSNQTPLILAVDRRHSEMAIFLLKQPDIDINAQDSNDKTLLMDAIRNCTPEVVSTLLINIKTNVDSINQFGETALIIATQCNRPEMVKVLLLARPDINMTHSDEEGKTALDYAQKARIKYILKTAMKKKETQSSLLKPSVVPSGFRPSSSSATSDTVHNKEKTVTMPYSDEELQEGEDAADVAYLIDAIPALIYLINTFEVETPEGKLFEEKDWPNDALEALENWKRTCDNIKQIREHYLTLIRYLALARLAPVLVLATELYGQKESMINVINDLLSIPGINVNATNRGGYTALMMASKNGSLEIVRELLKQAGIDLKVEYKLTNYSEAETALSFAEKNLLSYLDLDSDEYPSHEESHFKIVNLLLEVSENQARKRLGIEKPL